MHLLNHYRRSETVAKRFSLTKRWTLKNPIENVYFFLIEKYFKKVEKNRKTWFFKISKFSKIVFLIFENIDFFEISKNQKICFFLQLFFENILSVSKKKWSDFFKSISWSRRIVLKRFLNYCNGVKGIWRLKNFKFSWNLMKLHENWWQSITFGSASLKYSYFFPPTLPSKSGCISELRGSWVTVLVRYSSIRLGRTRHRSSRKRPKCAVYPVFSHQSECFRTALDGFQSFWTSAWTRLGRENHFGSVFEGSAF